MLNLCKIILQKQVGKSNDFPTYQTFYHICITCCIPRLTIVIPSQHDIPRRIGRPPLFINFTMSVLNPIAAIAIIIKNLDKSLSGTNTSAGTPTAVAIVVITLAPKKNKIKNGNTCFRDTLSPSFSSAFLALINASTSVIGIIAKVHVSFTIVTTFRVLLP